jgi:hypothetical protein
MREPPGIIRSGDWLCRAAEPFVAEAPPEDAGRLRTPADDHLIRRPPTYCDQTYVGLGDDTFKCSKVAVPVRRQPSLRITWSHRL